ncbi:MAG: YbhB/YbcL family Raf kinase inhibitor-like protein [Parachlamydiaceae bacterium]|nr:YbhB/YbcL family Raf kinase inhibitor-like protein [Parachlamydiaceae bacterium]
MKIDSSAFKNGEFIPEKYSYEGTNVSPPLAFHSVPKGTKSFALIVDDPDAPMGTFVHWLAWNIPAEIKGLPEGVVLAEQGKNGYKNVRYGGPCPPPGAPHRYFFKLYALDSLLTLPQGALKSKIEKAMEGHILAKAELVGLFQKHNLEK